jgi:hypothetical protein
VKRDLGPAAAVALAISGLGLAVAFTDRMGPALHPLGPPGAIGVVGYALVAATARATAPRVRRAGAVLAAGLAGTALLFALALAAGPVVLAGGMRLPATLAALVLAASQVWLLAAAHQEAAAGRTSFLALSGVVCALLVFLVAVVLYPVFSRGHGPRNEPSAIGDLRTFLSAQVAYQSAAGVHGTVECLVAPRGCLRDYPADAEPFLDRSFLQATRRGYRFSFHPGAEKAGDRGDRGFAAYAYVAVPEEPGVTGLRAFCGDEAGVIRMRSDGAMAAHDGRCPLDADPLR